MLTTALIRHVGSVVFGLVAILASIVTAVVSKVLVAETVVGFEVVLRVFGNGSVGELPIAGSRSNDWALLRLSVPADITSSSSRHCRSLSTGTRSTARPGTSLARSATATVPPMSGFSA